MAQSVRSPVRFECFLSAFKRLSAFLYSPGAVSEELDPDKAVHRKPGSRRVIKDPKFSASTNSPQLS